MALRGEYWWVRWRPDGLDWARCTTEEGLPRETGECTGWSDLPAPEGARLVVLVPPEAVRVHTVNIPTRSRARFRAALPFALEDQLLRDPEDYHFAPLPRPRGQTGTPVAVVDRERMDTWLAGSEGHGWRLRSLVPEYLAVAPPEEGVWLLDAAASPMLLRLPRGGGGAGLTGEPGDTPPGGLILALERAQPRPSTLRVRVAHAEQAERLAGWAERLKPLGLELEVQQDARERAAWLARQPLPAGGCNLLTGPYATGEDPRQWVRRLVPASAMLAALLVVGASQWFLEGTRIHAEHRDLEAAIESTYREAFPDARNLVDPRYQMEQRLQRLRSRQEESGGGGGLLARVDRVAPLLLAGGDTRVQALRYDGDSLTVEISVPDYQALERLQKRLAASGGAEVENAELKQGRVHGRIRLQGEA